MSLTQPADGATELKEAAASQTSADPVPNGLRGLSKSLVDRVRTAGMTHCKRGLL